MYNRSNFIIATIDSILQQQFEDFEIILIDDGSTDNTEQLITQKFSENNKIRYFKKENEERGAARNDGFRKANGVYVIFFDSDDIMLAHHLTTLHRTITERPGIKFLTTKFSYNIHGKERPSSMKNLKEGWHHGTIYLKGGATAVFVCILKNNVNLKLFEEDRIYSTLEDWMFLLQNILREHIYIIDEITIIVNEHPGRSMQGDNKQIIKKRILAASWIINNVSLTKAEIKILKGYTDYFCAVHSYADNNRRNALKYLLKALKLVGIKKSFLTLAIKIIAGHGLIQKLK